jgi:hypothetical protein
MNPSFMRCAGDVRCGVLWVSSKHSPEQELPVAHAFRIAFLCLLVAACGGDRRHVFQAPPPPGDHVAAPPVAAATPEPVLGTFAEARIEHVALAATGAPIALENVVDSFRVTTLVSTGNRPLQPHAGDRIELLFTGSSRLALEAPFGAVIPQVAAQVFVVATTRQRADGLAPGNYWMQVRLFVRDTTPLAQSVPLFVQVR